MQALTIKLVSVLLLAGSSVVAGDLKEYTTKETFKTISIKKDVKNVKGIDGKVVIKNLEVQKEEVIIHKPIVREAETISLLVVPEVAPVTVLSTWATSLNNSQISELRSVLNGLAQQDPSTIVNQNAVNKGEAAQTVQDQMATISARIDALTSLSTADLTSRIYSDVNVSGLEAAHISGWSGRGTSIGVYDHGTHGAGVTATATAVAPGATISYNGLSTNSGFVNQDITNHSYVSISLIPTRSALEGIASSYNAIDADNPNALHVLATPNAGMCNGQSVYTCDAAAQAFVSGYLDGTYIFVGAYGSGIGSHDYSSVASGASDILNGSFLVADGTEVFTGGSGASYAAPKVSGAAALINQKFSGLSAEDIKNVLLDSACSTCIDGYDITKHGQGLLDVGAALAPIGSLN